MNANTSPTTLPQILATRQVLQRADAQGERIGVLQYIATAAGIEVVEFWNLPNGRISRITSRGLRAGETF